MDIDAAARRACLWLPQAEEVRSHGSPDFRVRGKTFASYVVNHHGDGRVALWLNAPAGAQETLVRSQPKHFFVPPYVGVRGWVGVQLDQGIAWSRITALVREAYEHVAPALLREQVGKPPLFKAVPKKLRADAVDPFKSARAKKVLTGFRDTVCKLPRVSEGQQFGHPMWQVGKKTFAIARYQEGRLTLCFWIGVAEQGMRTQDPRYRIPPYIGHNGWIALDVHESSDWREVGALALGSYRHFALKSILKLLDG